MTDGPDRAPATDATLDEAAAERLLAKLRRFVNDDLDDVERALFAALVAPGVAEAYDVAPDVTGFDDRWRPPGLPAHLVRVIRERGLRVIEEP